jgi:hypothetical protein
MVERNTEAILKGSLYRKNLGNPGLIQFLKKTDKKGYTSTTYGGYLRLG